MGIFGWFNEEDNKTVEYNGFYIDYMSYSIVGKEEKIGSIYQCDGNFKFEEYSEEYDEEEGW